jgi:hypothetical protein
LPPGDLPRSALDAMSSAPKAKQTVASTIRDNLLRFNNALPMTIPRLGDHFRLLARDISG